MERKLLRTHLKRRRKKIKFSGLVNKPNMKGAFVKCGLELRGQML
jgi:hypothetical protein